MISSIKSYKDKKKAEKIVKDLSKLSGLIEKFISDVRDYDHYIPIKDIIFNIVDNKIIIELHLKKYKKILEDKNG